MILLRSDCLVFETAEGETVPLSASELAGQLLGELVGKKVPEEVVEHATAAVVFYFKNEQGRETVSLGEFAMALERVLRGFGLNKVGTGDAAVVPLVVADSDLRELATRSDMALELVFFSLLREELQRLLNSAPQVVQFSGLRDCVKQLLGVRRWTSHCQQLSDEIVNHLRSSMQICTRQTEPTLVVR